MRDYFHQIADELNSHVKGAEVALANFRGERSDFVRFNRSAVRQPGSVSEMHLAIDLIEHRRHAESHVVLSGILEEDRLRVAAAIDEARAGRDGQPEDPHLLFNETPRSSDRVERGRLPKGPEAVDAILAAGRGRDMVGIYAAGQIFTGFANSLGQRNWDEADSFNLDWSFYSGGDKAVKATYAGFTWDAAEFARVAAQSAEKLTALARPPKTIPPGEYRAYMTPAAMHEIVGVLAWGGFGLHAQRSRSTVFLRMIEGDARLHPSLTIREDTKDGAAPNFQREGFLKPDEVVLIKNGRYADCLVSPRSAVEYGVKTNGANAAEMTQSIDLAAGDLDEATILSALGTGVYVSNLWYMNFSDRSAGRLTGLTRFATFWVENGEIVAPLNVMRFDDTIYRMFGENLLGLTRQREFILDPLTYEARSSDSARLPGALIDNFRFTL
jgi:predicted Zn-dependent protease